MAIAEALVTTAADLAAPSGVSFPQIYTNSAADQETWNALIPGLAEQMAQGRFIMALIYPRETGTTVWDAKQKNFTFRPERDSLIAAYSLSPSVGRPYPPAKCSKHYVLNKIAELNGGAIDRGSERMFQVFQSSHKMHLNGLKAMLTVQSADEVAKAITVPEKYGWRGGALDGPWMADKRSTVIWSRGEPIVNQPSARLMGTRKSMKK